MRSGEMQYDQSKAWNETRLKIPIPNFLGRDEMLPFIVPPPTGCGIGFDRLDVVVCFDQISISIPARGDAFHFPTGPHLLHLRRAVGPR